MNNIEDSLVNKMATEVFTLGQVKSESLTSESLNDRIKSYMLSKSPEVSRAFNIGYLNNSTSISGVTTFKEVLRMLKDSLVEKSKGSVQKEMTVRKTFDTLLAALEVLNIHGIDIDCEEFKGMLLGYISRNLK